MELVALVIGALIGIIIGQILYAKRLKKRFAGTLVMDSSDENARPDIYVAWNEDPSFLKDLDCVFLDIKVVSESSHK